MQSKFDYDESRFGYENIQTRVLLVAYKYNGNMTFMKKKYF